MFLAIVGTAMMDIQETAIHAKSYWFLPMLTFSAIVGIAMTAIRNQGAIATN